MDWLKAGKSVLKGTADVTFVAASEVARREDSLRQATGNLIGGAGKVLASAGALGSQTATGMAGRLHRHADHADGLAIKGASRAAAWAATALSLPGRALRRSGELAGKAAPHIGSATGGVVAGGASIASGLIDRVALSQAQISALREELRQHGARIAEDSAALQRRIASAARRHRRSQLLDMLTVGGLSLGVAHQHPGQIPTHVTRAFALARPELAAAGSFADALQTVSAAQLPALAGAVKGKLLELALVEHFNAGNLPAGMQADMGMSATQAERVIRIVDEYGLVADPLQATLSQSLDYVLQALEDHPGVDVRSATQVHAELLALALAQTVRDDGMDAAALQHAIAQAGDAAALPFSADDLLPSALGMGVITLSLLLDKDMLANQIHDATSTGSGSHSTGKGSSLVDSGLIWWSGLLAGVSSQWLAGRGRSRRQQYQTLQQAVEHLRAHATHPPGLQPFVV